MTSTSPDSHDILIAWAMPVSLAQLGARVEAYVATKGTITAFRLTARNTRLKAFRNLPEEILLMIDNQLRDNFFRLAMKDWVGMQKCLAHECDPLSHADLSVIPDFAGSFRHPIPEEDMIDALDEEGALTEAHLDDLAAYYHKLTKLDGNSNFARCIFIQDFGVRPYFLLHKVYAPDPYDSPYNIDNVRAKAYLALVLTKIPHVSNPGPELASFAIESSLDPSILIQLAQGLSEAQRQQFKTAARVLNLHPFDLNEDESIYEGEPLGRYFSHYCYDCDSEVESLDNRDLEASNHDSGVAEDSPDTLKNLASVNDMPKPGSSTNLGTPLEPQAASNPESPANADAPANPQPANNMEVTLISPSSSDSKPQEQHLEEEMSTKIEPTHQETWPKLMFLRCGITSAYSVDW